MSRMGFGGGRSGSYEGAVYHVTARGNERREIFRDDADREHFLRVLARAWDASRCGCTCSGRTGSGGRGQALKQA